jgi:hypothetical protein
MIVFSSVVFVCVVILAIVVVAIAITLWVILAVIDYRGASLGVPGLARLPRRNTCSYCTPHRFLRWFRCGGLSVGKEDAAQVRKTIETEHAEEKKAFAEHKTGDSLTPQMKV